MRIDAMVALPPGAGVPGPSPVIDLDQRLAARAAERPHDPDLDAFYQALLDWPATGHARVFDFMRHYTTASNERPYATTSAQMEVLQAVLQRLKDQGLENTPLYEQTYAAFTSVFGIKGFVAEFSRQVFDPQVKEEMDETTSW
jgi:hypothetical protein